MQSLPRRARVDCSCDSEQPITEIRYSDRLQVLAGQVWNSGKTRNNYAIALRSVFDLAFVDGLIERNPAERLRNVKVQHPEPDPLSLDEVVKFISEMRSGT